MCVNELLQFSQNLKTIGVLKMNVILADDTGGVIEVFSLQSEPCSSIELSENVSDVLL